MNNILKLVFVFLFLSLLVIRPTPSYAWWHDHDRWHGYTDVDFNFGAWPGTDYYYPDYAYPDYDYPYYYPAYSVVSSSSFQPVVVNGVTYYVNNGVYYVYTQYGYQAVATPAGVTPTASVITPPQDTGDTFTINIPNKNGGYTTVLLKKSGNGYIGPQGEYYPEFPTVSKLRVMYGK